MLRSESSTCSRATVEANQLRVSAGERADHYARAVELWSETPVIGQGAGGWSIAVGSGDVARHPHNLFLEVLVEGGLVGLILLVMLLATALRPVSMARLRTDPFALCSLMLFANAFLNAMVSGDLPDNRTMFLMLGLLALFTIHRPGPES